MDNSAFCNDPSLWRKKPNMRKIIVNDWKESQTIIKEFHSTIVSMRTKSTEEFRKMKEIRDDIKLQFTATTYQITNLVNVKAELKKIQINLADTENRQKKYKDFVKTTRIPEKKVSSAPFHSTVCITHMHIGIICHENCGLDERTTRDNEFFSGCSCINNNYCTECKCHHTRYSFIFCQTNNLILLFWWPDLSFL